IIEGYIEKGADPLWEGPFGDHTGFYSPADWYPKFNVTCITHRRDAIYSATLVGVPPQEDKYIAEATEKIFLTPIKFALLPEIVDLHLPEEGCGHNFAVVKIEKSYPGQAIKVANALWGAGQMMFNKIMVVVDEAIDIRNRSAILKAIGKNYFPPSDTHFSRGPSDILDHAAPTMGYGGKVMIDATRKLVEESDHPTQRESSKEIEPIHFYQIGEEPKGKISILIEGKLKDEYLSYWLWGANCDPVRDSHIVEGKLHFDATSKQKGKQIREWPPIAHSNKETIEKIDQKWERLNIGESLASPSLRFLK
ncbi:MAG: UbiD family decarboxylase domain-containing protein, partial [Bacteroidales bacterium]